MGGKLVKPFQCPDPLMVSVSSLHPPDCLWFSVLVRQFCLTAAGGLSLGFSCASVTGLRQIRSVNLHCGFRKQDNESPMKVSKAVFVLSLLFLWYRKGCSFPLSLGWGQLPAHPMAGGSSL